MSRYKPLTYNDIVKILRNLGFQLSPTGATSHQTWIISRDNIPFAVTIMFHGSNVEFKKGTLGSIIRQSGFTKDEFYNALKNKRKINI